MLGEASAYLYRVVQKLTSELPKNLNKSYENLLTRLDFFVKSQCQRRTTIFKFVLNILCTISYIMSMIVRETSLDLEWGRLTQHYQPKYCWMANSERWDPHSTFVFKTLTLWTYFCGAKMTTDSSEYVQLRATEPIYGTELHHVNLLHSNQISIVPKDRSLYKSGCKWINVTPAKYSPVV